MTRDELEYTLSQYLDGTLAASDESALEQRLATDEPARALLSEYRSLDRALRASPLPAFDFDALASTISAAVAAQDEPAQSYRLHWVRTAASLALAACVVIAAGVGIRRQAGGRAIELQDADARRVGEHARDDAVAPRFDVDGGAEAVPHAPIAQVTLEDRHVVDPQLDRALAATTRSCGLFAVKKVSA